MDVLNIHAAFQTEVQRERAAREQAEARATAAESNHADGTNTGAIHLSQGGSKLKHLKMGSLRFT